MKNFPKKRKYIARKYKINGKSYNKNQDQYYYIRVLTVAVLIQFEYSFNSELALKCTQEMMANNASNNKVSCAVLIFYKFTLTFLF
jgi:hypothetical protein